MRKAIAICCALVALMLPPLAFAATVQCPEHGYASCYNTFETKLAEDGRLLYKYNCTCGDNWWVREH
jgi:hypothetical protein